MRKTILFVASLILANTISTANANECGKQCRLSPDSTLLTISAEAEHKASPDIALMSAGVVTISLKAKDALKENSEKMNKVIKELKLAGIEEKYIQTSSINIRPNYVHRKNLGPKVTGYTVRNTVSIKIKDLKKIGKTIDALVSQGANNLSGPHFSIENPDKFIDLARKAAFKKAQKKAELYADVAGLKIKKIMSLSESVRKNSPINRRMMHSKFESSSSSTPTPIQAGEVNLSVHVNIKYELTN